MERENSPDEKRESPSQDTIFHLKPSKRDIESLEDFEDITKDFSSMKDITTQFLQNESDGRKKQSYESLSRSDDHFDLNQKVNLDPSSNLTQNFKDFESNEEEKRYKDSDLSTESLTSEVKESLENLKPHLDNPFNDFMHFEQTDSRNNKIKNNDAKDLEVEENLENLDNEIVLDDNKLVDVPSTDEVSSGSDDLSFIPKMGESSPLLHSGLDVDVTNKPVSECKSNDGTDMFFSSPPPKYISEPVLIRERESEIVQGDGFHVKESDDGDISESEEFIPEPIPKDYPEIGAIEGKQFLEAMGLDTWFHPDLLNPKIESLIYWRDPKKSGVVFGSVLVILLSLTTFSLISVVAYTSLIVLMAALAFRIYKNVLQAVQKTSEGHPFKTYLLAVLNHSTITAVFMSITEYLDIDLTLNPDKAREISDVVVSCINKGLTKSRSLFLVEDVVDSVKFGLGLWCLTYVGSWFNGLSLIIIAFVGLFTLPKVYENNKSQIDANLNVVKTKINEITEKIKAVSPVGKKTEESKNKSE